MIKRLEEALKLANDLPLKEATPGVKKIRGPSKRGYKYSLLREGEETMHFNTLQEIADHLEVTYSCVAHLFHYTPTNNGEHRGKTNEKLKDVRIIKYVQMEENKI